MMLTTPSKRKGIFEKALSSLRRKADRRQRHKNAFTKSPASLRSGLWRGDGRLFWQNSVDRARVERMFYSLYNRRRNGRAKTGSVVKGLMRKAGSKLSPASYHFVPGRQRQGASVAFFSRSGEVKFFDFDDDIIVTTLPEKSANSLSSVKSHDLFSFFPTVDFGISRTPDGQFYKTEKLIGFPSIGMQPLNKQRLALNKISQTYSAYAKTRSQEPTPDVFMSCFEDVIQRLNSTAQAALSLHRESYIHFVQSARTIEGHLDFNIGNFIGEDELYLLDIGSTGLRLPVTYDINNLLLNEVYEGRSIALLLEALDDPDQFQISELVRVANPDFGKDMFKISLVTNFVLRESSYVSDSLFQTHDPAKAQRAWNVFSDRLPGWPFIDLEPQ